MADLNPMDEFLHPLPEDGLEKAKSYAGMWKKLKQKYQTEAGSSVSKYALNLNFSKFKSIFLLTYTGREKLIRTRLIRTST